MLRVDVSPYRVDHSTFDIALTTRAYANVAIVVKETITQEGAVRHVILKTPAARREPHDLEHRNFGIMLTACANANIKHQL